MPLAIAISPHLDDAVFSAGASLAHLAASGWRVVIATVFTRSVPHPTGFALECQRDKGLPDHLDYMALRRDEDAAACDRLGVAPVWLDLPEAPHRGYDTAAALFGGLHVGDAPDVTTPLAALLGQARPDLLLAPQAIGGHVDHVHVVHAVRAARGASPVLWWRDFPYDSREAARATLFVFDGLPEMVLTLTEADLRRRRAACSAYGSQIGFQFGGTDGLDATLSRRAREVFAAQGAVPPLG